MIYRNTVQRAMTLEAVRRLHAHPTAEEVYRQVAAEHPSVSRDDSNPRFSWGKFTEENGRVTLPVSLFVNHALADGLHIARFFQGLETELAALCAQWKAEQINL